MPARLSDIGRGMRALLGRLEKPGKGSHWKCYNAAGKMYPIPAGNGERTEISDRYIKGLCKELGLDEVEFRKHL